MPAHPINGEYPVMVAVNNMTGVWEEFALAEHDEFKKWSEDMQARGWSVKKATLREVLQNIDDHPSGVRSA